MLSLLGFVPLCLLPHYCIYTAITELWLENLCSVARNLHFSVFSTYLQSPTHIRIVFNWPFFLTSQVSSSSFCKIFVKILYISHSSSLMLHSLLIPFMLLDDWVFYLQNTSYKRSYLCFSWTLSWLRPHICQEYLLQTTAKSRAQTILLFSLKQSHTISSRVSGSFSTTVCCTVVCYL